MAAAALWTLLLAVAVAAAAAVDCTVSVDGTMHDFSHLHDNSSNWVVVSPMFQNTEIIINVCGELASPPVGCEEASACLVQFNTATSLGKFTEGPTLNGDGFELDYTGGGAPRPGCSSSSVMIRFACGPITRLPYLLSDDHCRYNVLWETQWACTDNDNDPDLVETQCVTVDQTTGLVYDLSPLERSETNWLVASEEVDWVFEINVCRNLVKTATIQKFAKCQSTSNNPVSGCGYNTAGTKAISLGWPHRPVLEDGILTTRLTGFDANFSQTVIAFACDPGVGLGVPELRDIQGNEYFFEWTTSAACPLMPQIGDNCAVQDSVTGHEFDFSSLAGTTFTGQSTDGKAVKLSLCGPLPAADACGDGSAVCVDGQMRAKASSTVQLDDRVLTMEVLSDDTSASPSAIIRLKCDPTATSADKASMIVEAVDDDEVRVTIKTAYACEGDPPAECFVEFEGTKYDLAPLTLVDGNWEVEGTSDYWPKGSRFVINICRELTRTSDDPDVQRCPSGAAACLISPSKVLSYGTVSGPIKADNTPLRLVFSDESSGRTASIQFGCATTDGDLGEPSLVSVSADQKHAYVHWSSTAACPVKKQQGHRCLVRDHVTGQSFDLHRLYRNKFYYPVHTDAYDFYLDICDGGGLPSSVEGCEGSGACRVAKGSKEAISLGKPNDILYLEEGSIYQSFAEGSECATGKPYETLVSFVCSTVDGTDGPMFRPDLGNGCLFVFEWPTVAACSVVEEVECVVTGVNGQQYDLSSLSKETGNWVVKGTNGFAYSFNICRAINNVDTIGCPDGTAACQTDSEGHSISIGQPRHPQFKREESDNTYGGHVFFNYDSGANCGTAHIQLHTRIDFTCDPSAGIGKPEFVGKAGCQYNIEWVTSAACPINDEPQGKDCKVTNPVTKEVFDFSPLTSTTPYKVHGHDVYQYLLNVCGTVPCGEEATAAGCQLKPTDPTFANYTTGLSSSAPQWINGNPTLVYNHGTQCGNGPRTTIITFYCDPKSDGQPVFVNEDEGCTYIFSWYTKYACSEGQEALDCTAEDPVNGTVYDLSALINNEANWFARDNREEFQKWTYQINVCRELVQDDLLKHGCGNGQAACQTYSNEENDKGLGAVSGPIVHNGVLYLQYVGGTPCSDGVPRSTRIEFACPYDENGNVIVGQLDGPVFLEESHCQYHFLWETTAACPVEALQGDNCRVQDSVTGIEYDLSPLQGRVKTKLIGAVSFKLAACGAVPSCGGSNTTGACASGSSVGDFNDNLIIDDGKLSLRYTSNTPCPGAETAGETYETVIEFECDQQDSDVVEFADFSGCTYVFVWKTKQACAPFNEVECVTIDYDTGATYDLSSLSLPNDNWVARDAREDNKYSYELNVCRTLTPVSGFAGCQRGAAACQVSHTNAGFDEANLGTVTSGPVAKNGQLYIEYFNGDVCYSANKPRSTRINFYCSKEEDLTGPVFVTETPDCQYVFSWNTPAACPMGGTGPTTQAPTNSDCTVEDVENGVLYNLRALKDLGTVEAGSPNRDDNGLPYTYHVSVCGKSQCGDDPNAGVCQTSTSGETTTVGVASTTPNFVDGVVQLHYTTATECPGNPSKKIETTIFFMCDTRYGDGTPLLQDVSDDCHYYFSWRTAHVCAPAHTSLPCFVNDIGKNVTYDLGVLTRSDGQNWLAYDNRVDNYTYSINVCHTLLPINDPLGNCAGAAACQTKPGDPNFAFNMGTIAPNSLSLSFGTDSTPNLAIDYDLPEDSPMRQTCHDKYQRKTHIDFECKHGTLGHPVFTSETDECVYQFLWRTAAACSVHQTQGDNCKVREANSELVFDLNPLMKVYNQPTTPSADNGNFIVGGCGTKGVQNIAGCQGSGVCRFENGQWKSYGKPTSQITYGDGALFLTYNRDETCTATNKPKQTIVHFVCDPEVDSGEPVYDAQDSSDCITMFEWATVHACISKQEVDCVAVDPKSGVEFDLSVLTKTDGNWEVVDGEYTYEINVCQTVNTGTAETAACDPMAAVCQRKSSEPRVWNVGGVFQSPVYEDGKIKLKYENGENQDCPSGEVRQTGITFICGKSNFPEEPLGKPEFASNVGCDYEFTWQTPAACLPGTIVIPTTTGTTTKAGQTTTTTTKAGQTTTTTKAGQTTTTTKASATTTTTKHSGGVTTTSGKPATTGGTTKSSAKTKKSGGGGGSTMTIAIVSVVIVLVIAIAVFIIMKKGGFAKLCKRGASYNPLSSHYHTADDTDDEFDDTDSIDDL